MTEADFMTALHGYISSITGMDGKRIFRGYQSRMVLPKDGQYCIYTPIIRQRRGTNVYDFDAEGKLDTENGIDNISALILIDVQVDFYGENAMSHAQTIEIASRSYLGSNYFKQTGTDVRVCTATNPRNLTGIDTSNQYESRWMVTLTVEVNSTIASSLPWFVDVHFRRAVEVIPPGGTEPIKVYKDGFVDVDAEFPPTETE